MTTVQIWEPRDSRWPVRTWRDLMSVPHRGFGDWRQGIRTALATGLAFLIASHLGPGNASILAALVAALGSQLTPLGTFAAISQQVLGAWCGLIIALLGLTVFGSVTLPAVMAVGLVAMLVAQILPVGPLGKGQVLILTFYVLTVSNLQNAYQLAPWQALAILVGGLSAMLVSLAWPSRFPILKLENSAKALVDQIRAALSTTASQLRTSAGTELDIHEHHEFREVGDALVPRVLAGDLAAAQGRESAVWNWQAQGRLSRLDRLEDKWDWLGTIQGPLRALVQVIDDLYDHSDRYSPLLDRNALVAILEETRSLFEVAAGSSHTGDIAKASDRLAVRIEDARRAVVAEAPDGNRSDPIVIGSLELLDRLDVLRGNITVIPH